MTGSGTRALSGARVAAEVFREYDLRGVFGEDLTSEVAELIGRAYRGLLPEGAPRRVAVGRDARLSSPNLAAALARGLSSGGLDVIDIGLCPTPALYYALFTEDVAGGIMVTGSHNPPEFNGFKVAVGRSTIYGAEIQRLRAMVDEEARRPAGARDVGTVSEAPILEGYARYLEEAFAHLRRLPRLKVALDCGNGAAGVVAPRVIEAAGCKIVSLYAEPDGRFPNHHPDPTLEETLADLKRAVRDEGCDLGLAFDGDGDRLGVVDERGDVIWGDRLLALLAEDVLAENPGAAVIGEVKCSQVLYDRVEALGGRPIMAKTGHSLIKARMKTEAALIAGEMSGHFFFADRYFGYDDAVYAALRAVELLKRRRAADAGSTMSAIAGVLPRTYATPEIRVECAEDDKAATLGRARRGLAERRDELGVLDVDETDGLRVRFEAGWGLIRASNTQPVLVLRFEGESPQALETIEARMRGLLA